MVRNKKAILFPGDTGVDQPQFENFFACILKTKNALILPYPREQF